MIPLSDVSVLLPDTPPAEPEAEEPPADGTPMAEPPTEAELNRLAAEEVAKHYLEFSLGFDNPPTELLPPAHAPQATEPPTVTTPEQQPAPSPAGSTSAPVRALGWKFFAPEILNRLFVFYTHGGELDWAERMWTALGARGLTNYTTAAEYNRVLVRLAVLARYLKCWIWKAYDDSGDPYWEDYDDWLEVLPLVRSALPPPEPSETKGQQSEETDATRDLLAKMIWAENDAVFTAVIRTYGECDEIELAHDLRHACGMRDDFGAHAEYGSSADDLGEQKKFFDECGLSLRELECVSRIIGNWFCF